MSLSGHLLRKDGAMEVPESNAHVEKSSAQAAFLAAAARTHDIQ